jgi:glycosyltransferase involved in cell wall biosynthesis
MKILYVAGREAAYSRTRIVLNALRQNGFEVVECLPPDKSFKHYPGLLLKTLLSAPRCDAVVVGFYGQLLAPLVRLLTWKPILFDMYITTYDTMVFDREKAAPGTLKARIYGLSDWLSYKMTRLSILDSHYAIGHFGRTIHTKTSKFRRLFLAVDDSVIKPGPARPADGEFLVHFHGEYIPFHGVRHILKAAKLLEPYGVKFQIVGKGLTFDEDMQLARELGLPHVKFLDPVPYAKLAELMARADVCLGIFGDNERAKLVLTNKVVEAIGVGKPLITRRNEPVQELLKDGESVLLVNPADPQALADAILRLKNDEALRLRIAANGHAVFQQQCATRTFGQHFTAILHELLGMRRAAE